MKRFKYLTLAALVAVAACDEGVDPVVTPVTGIVTGVVTIEAVAAVGVTVTLSNGSVTTTDGAGLFTFAGVPTGSYTVTISGFASDATFTATFKAATIASSGEVATANFDGSFVRTSAISGSVSVGGTPLQSVAVAIGGMSSAGMATDELGQFSFSGLRAGSYTVEMTNPNTASYNFGSMSASVTLATGASEVVTFDGSLVTTASISGSLFIDEFSKDSILNTGLEDKLAIANVPVRLEGILVLDTMTVLTDATGSFSFSDLAEGSYYIQIMSFANVPGMVALAGTNPLIKTVGVAESATADFPFSIITQTITVGGFLGIDGTSPGITPISGWTVNLYDTQLNAAAATATGLLGSAATSSAGISTFRFARTLDVSPNAATSDQIVFAQVAGAPTGTYVMSGEAIIEIKYAGTDSSSMAPDTFDALYNALTIAVNGAEIDGDPLPAWQAVLRANKDTTGAVTMSGALDAAGWGYFDITLANIAATSDGALPDTLYLRLSTTQASANGHGFTQAPTSKEGTSAGGQVKFIWDGTVAANDTVWVGTETVTYTDVDVLVGVHHEKDDSTDVATFTLGDATASVAAGSVVQLYDNTTGTPVSAGAAVAPGSAGAAFKAWERPFFNVGVVAKTWQVRARAVDVNLNVLNDSSIDFTVDGSDQVDTIATLSGGGGVSTFALKANNTSVTGTITSVDGATAVAGMRVNIVATSDNIQPNTRGGTAATDSTVVLTTAAGTYSMTAMREGPYTVTVQDSTGVWAFKTTLLTVTQDGNVLADGAIGVAGTDKASRAVVNTDAFNGTRDNEGYARTSVANFAAHRMDTKVEGVVVNDRDADYHTLDPGEALAAVTITLIDDADADGVVDAGEVTVATATTDATGAYAFSGLQEDNYIVSAASPANATVLRALSATGVLTNTAAVLTTATTGVGSTLNQNNTNQVGDVNPPGQNDEFPRWDYLLGRAATDGGHLGAGLGPNRLNAVAGVVNTLTTTPTHFVHLFATGTVTGKVVSAVVGATTLGVGVTGVTVTITRCQVASAAPSPPLAGRCTVKHGTPSSHIQNVDTDANGVYTFTSLLEGVYQIDVAPATAGYTNAEGPDDIAVGGVGDTDDINLITTLKGDLDVETVQDYVIS